MKNRNLLSFLCLNVSDFVQGVDLYIYNQYINLYSYNLFGKELVRIKLEIRKLKDTLLSAQCELRVLSHNKNIMTSGIYQNLLLSFQIEILANQIANIKRNVELLEVQIQHKENLYSLYQDSQYIISVFQDLTDRILVRYERNNEFEIKLSNSQSHIFKLLKELYIHNLDLVEWDKISSNRYFIDLNQFQINSQKSRIAYLKNQINILYIDLLSDEFYNQNDCMISQNNNIIHHISEKLFDCVKRFYEVYQLTNTSFFKLFTSIKVKTIFEIKLIHSSLCKSYGRMENVIHELMKDITHLYHYHFTLNDFIVTEYKKLKYFFDTSFFYKSKYQLESMDLSNFSWRNYLTMDGIKNRIIINSKKLINQYLSQETLRIFSFRFNNLMVHSPPLVFEYSGINCTYPHSKIIQSQ